MSEINIKNRIIGEDYPVYIIAEMSANHAGSVERAKEIIYAARESGADCIKIQTYTADELTIDCNNKYFHIDNGTWMGESLYGLYQKAYTPWEWQPELKAEADRIGIDFLSTPFSKKAVDFLEDMGIDFYKIASFELIDIPLIEYTASKGKPILLSTGMGTLEEIEEAVAAIRQNGNNQFALLKCCSSYPAILKDMNLKTISNLKERFGTVVGLSDHSMGYVSAVTAVAMGARIIEKHFCISREIENPDASFSMNPYEFKIMAEDIRMAEKAMGKISYNITDSENDSRIFRKSIFAVEDIEIGEIITDKNVRIIRPGYGMKPKFYKDIIGLTASVSIKKGTPLESGMLDMERNKGR